MKRARPPTQHIDTHETEDQRAVPHLKAFASDLRNRYGLTPLLHESAATGRPYVDVNVADVGHVRVFAGRASFWFAKPRCRFAWLDDVPEAVDEFIRTINRAQRRLHHERAARIFTGPVHGRGHGGRAAW